jgi:hypothetical protein
MSTQFMFQRLAGGAGTVLIGAAAQRYGLRTPMLIAAGLAMTAWAIAFANRNPIMAAFGKPR